MMRDEVLLICRRCNTQASVPSDRLVAGVPVLDWFIGRHHLCSACFALLAEPKAKVAKNATSTSRAAALAVAPKSGTKRAQVLEAIKAQPMTDEEIQQYLSMSPNTQRPRRVELVEGGFIRDSQRRKRTSTGNQSIIWESK